MTPEFHVLLSGALTFGVPILLGLRELRALRRGHGGWTPDAPPPAPQPMPQGGSGRPLPECLMPKLPARPVAQRTPELV